MLVHLKVESWRDYGRVAGRRTIRAVEGIQLEEFLKNLLEANANLSEINGDSSEFTRKDWEKTNKTSRTHWDLATFTCRQ
jgi:chorismate synthase